MGRVPGQAREARLTEPLWHDGPLDRLQPVPGRPVAWSVRLDSDAAAAALAATPHSDRDLADFAAAPDAGNRLLRRRLSRALVARLANVAPGAVLFGRTAEGAPSVLSPKGCHLSVAGRVPLCLICLAGEPVGADVESLDPAPPLWDMLACGEAAEIAALAAGEQPREWLRRCAAKEAHAKRLRYARSADPAAILTRRDGATLSAQSPEGVSRVYLREPSGRIEAIALAEG